MIVVPFETRRASAKTASAASFVFRDIEQNRRATRYLHAPPLLVEAVDGVDKVDPLQRG